MDDFTLVSESDVALMEGTPGFAHIQTWVNWRYIVLVGVIAEVEGARHLMIVPKHHDAVYWWEKQAIKNAIVGEDVWAYESFPPTDELIDDEHMFHLFCGMRPPVTL